MSLISRIRGPQSFKISKMIRSIASRLTTPLLRVPVQRLIPIRYYHQNVVDHCKEAISSFSLTFLFSFHQTLPPLQLTLMSYYVICLLFILQMRTLEMWVPSIRTLQTLAPVSLCLYQQTNDSNIPFQQLFPSITSIYLSIMIVA
jgi:hypothetical protein